jgi:hypothetical protein
MNIHEILLMIYIKKILFLSRQFNWLEIHKKGNFYLLPSG